MTAAPARNPARDASLTGARTLGNLAALLKELDPARELYCQYNADRWQGYCAADVSALAAQWQTSFRANGFQPGDRIALCLRNSVHWVAIDQAALGLGLVIVPLYADDNADNIAWCLRDSEARLLVIESDRILKGLQAGGHQLPLTVTLKDEAKAPAITAQTWLAAPSDEFEVRQLDAHALASIVYTSGTSGRPKGVQLTHANILSNIAGVLARVRFTSDDHFLSLLPLSHMFERTCGYYVPLAGAAKVSFSRGVTRLADDLASQRPTIMIAVPRVYERFVARVEEALKKSAAKRALFKLAVDSGSRIVGGKASLFDRIAYPRLKALVAKPIMDKLGGRLTLTVVGGAKLEARIARILVGLGLDVVHGYGMTEASPVISATDQDGDDLESVGRLFPNFEGKLNGDGALLVRGPSVMSGYWRNPEASQAVLSLDGWLNTGDLAEIRAGRVYIRGRLKDIMVLSNGEKFPPQDVENAILGDPVFEQIMLVGEGQSFVSLLAVTRERDEKKLVAAANARLKEFPRYVRVRRVVPLDEAWTIDNGLLTPTLKVKRPAVLQRFKMAIDAIYA